MSSRFPATPRTCTTWSPGELLKQLSEQTTRLVHQELELGRWPTVQKAQAAGVSLFGWAGALGLAALGALTACFILALDAVMPAWLAALIVAVIYGIVAFVLVKQGQAKMKAAAPAGARADHRDGEGGRGMGQEPDAIRQDIEQTRTEMSETVEAVGYKADVPSRAKDAVSDKVENMKSKVSDTATRAKGGRGRNRVPGRRRYPQPGAGQAGGSAGGRHGQGEPARAGHRRRRVGVLGRVGRALDPGRGREARPCVRSGLWTRSRRPAREALDRGKQVAQEVASTATETAKEKTQEHGQDLAESAKQRAQDLGDQTSQTSRSQTGNAGTRRPRSKPPPAVSTLSILDRQIKRR